MENKVLFTIGTSDRPAEEFISLLKKHGITQVIDVRSKTGSRTLHFDESRFQNLSKLLKNNGIQYDLSLHLTLGGLQNGKMTVGNFRKHMATDYFHRAISQLKVKIAETDGHTVILCCERDYLKCHRKMIAEVMANDGYKIVHL